MIINIYSCQKIIKKKSHKFKKILNKDDNRVRVNILNESTAWHCGECRKIVMMADSDG